MKRRTFVGSLPLLGFPLVARGQENGYLQAGQRGFGDSCRLFNSALSPAPEYVAPCRTADEVKEAVRFAAGRGLPVSVKSGGHCFMGSSMADGSVAIDLGNCSARVLETETGRLTAGPGIKLGALSDFLRPKGRLLPAGTCAGVGLGGLTLGGGYGFFARQYGLTCDHLMRVKMIDGRGELVDSGDDPDLLWACRGGGNGNFGVVVSMEFETRPVRETFATQRFTAKGLTAERARALMESWFTITAELPDPMFSAFVLNGKQITVLVTSIYRSQGPAFQKTASSLVAAGFQTKGALDSPIAKALKRYHGQPGPLPFHNVSGGYYENFRSLEKCADLICESCTRQPGLIFQVNTLGGAITRGADSAYPHRSFPYLGEIQAYWEDARHKDTLVHAVAGLREAIGAKAHYRNYPEADLPGWEQAYYGDSAARLRTLKARYDPGNLFRHAQSVPLPTDGAK